ncbi:MAG: hypothetical protein KGJ55_05280 [Gammaproteobacteria bacterium]|nr:hypothetical protein [Gammaproteobacteria bacterium]
MPIPAGDEFSQAAPRPPVAWAETVVATLLLPIVGLALHRQDPLFLHGAFPWLIFAPLLVGGRYGFLYGFSSALLTVAMMLLAWRTAGLPEHGFPYQYALAAVIVGMFAGELADLWLRRLARMQLINEYAGSRLSEFTRSYHLLKASHDQLEERLADQRYNLRDALADLRKKFTAAGGSDILHRSAEQILEFLAVHGQLQKAWLYEVFDNNRLGETPLATLGTPPVPLEREHPMLRACLERGQLISVRTDGPEPAARWQRQGLLAVIPLVDIRGRIWAVVAVRTMPFIVFHRKNLNLLAVIGSHLGDLIADSLRQTRPAGSAPAEDVFCDELRLWVLYAARYGLESLLVGVELAPAVSADGAPLRLDHLLFEQMRTLDSGLRLANARGGHSLLVLMPLTGIAGADGYRKRIGRLVEAQLGRPAGDELLVLHVYALSGSGNDAAAIFRRACAECHVARA